MKAHLLKKLPFMETNSSLQYSQKPAKLENLGNIRNEAPFSSLVICSPRQTP
jgi:hypothetical protein